MVEMVCCLWFNVSGCNLRVKISVMSSHLSFSGFGSHEPQAKCTEFQDSEMNLLFIFIFVLKTRCRFITTLAKKVGGIKVVEI